MDAMQSYKLVQRLIQDSASIPTPVGRAPHSALVTKRLRDMADRELNFTTCGYLNPRTRSQLLRSGSTAVPSIRARILFLAFSWNIKLTMEHLISYESDAETFNFNTELEPMEAWKCWAESPHVVGFEELWRFVRAFNVISPSEACVERLFSLAKHVMTSRSPRMSVDTLESELILAFNKGI